MARGAHELRVKESDRIATMRAALEANGVSLRGVDDGLAITGTGGAPIPRRRAMPSRSSTTASR